MRLIKRSDLFDDFFYNFFRTDTTDLARTDIYEDDKNYFIDIEVPGFKKENIKVELNDGYLVIKASLDENKEEKNEELKYHVKQRNFVECARKYKLADGVTEKDIKVKLEDGVLKIQVIKPEKLIPVSKTIEIE